VSERSRQPYLVAAAILAVALATAIGLVVGYQLNDDSGSVVMPADDSVDAGFTRDMQVHHGQAVQMSMVVRDNTDDPAVRTLAYDIATTQQQQIGQMFAWLDMWGLSQYSQNPSMAWMTDDGGGHDMANMDRMDDGEPVSANAMPGMATPAQLEELQTAHGEAASVLYLQLMIRHHLGGIEMAQYALDHAEVDQVRQLAETIVTSQQAEVSAMNDMLVERGAEPIESLDE
jgi:uncharacterized protein (DUF305 family)